MLTTAIQIPISVKIDDADTQKDFLGVSNYVCSCYGDSKDKNVYYVFPQVPTFAPAESKDGKPNPKFMYYMYRGGQEGGYAMFTVQLKQPNDYLKTQIQTKLMGKAGDILRLKSGRIVAMVKAYQAFQKEPKNTTLKTAYQNALQASGIPGNEAKSYINSYDADNGDDQFLNQLLPKSAGEIQLKQPDYRSSSVSLILDDNEGFFQEIPSDFDPSGTGDQTVVFNMSLTADGAALFEKVLKGTESGSSVGVKYTFNLNASLPAATVTVSVKASQMKSASQTITKHTWSADDKSITQTFTDSGAATVNIETGVTAEQMGGEEAFNAWKTGLQKWGQDQLKQILMTQTGLDMSADMLKDADGYRKFKNSMQNVTDITRVYSENTVVAFSIYPQGQLPSISSIVGSAKVDEYFKAYDLNIPFFEKIQPSFTVAGDLAKYNIASVVVTAKYKDDNVSTLVWDGSTTEKTQKTDEWYIDDKLGRQYTYSYVVNFTGASAKPYQSPVIAVKDSLSESINIADAGIVYGPVTSLLTADSWKVYDHVELKMQYDDKIDTQVLNATQNTPQPFVYPIGKIPEGKIYYSAEYFKDGDSFYYLDQGAVTNPQLPGYAASLSNQLITVDNPLSWAPEVTLVVPDSADTKLMIIDLSVSYSSPSYSQSQKVTLNSGFDNYQVPTLTFELLPKRFNDTATAQYVLTIIKDGAPPKKVTKDVSMKDISNGTVMIDLS